MKDIGKSEHQLFLQFKDHKLNSTQIQGTQFKSQFSKKKPESHLDSELENKVKDLKNQNLNLMKQMDDMRKNYHKELSAKSGLEYMNEIQRKKRYEKTALKVNNFGKSMPHELIEPFNYGQEVHFFDATNNIDKSIKDMLNQKLQKMKDNFQDWQVRSIDYTTSLLKKLYMYEQVSKEYHGIVNMTSKQIFEGIKLMDERPEDLWENVVDVFGHQFFLPVIEKYYAHLFVNDTSKQNMEIQSALSQTTKNEENIRYQCDEQLQDFKQKIQELQNQVIDQNLKSEIQIQKARQEGLIQGKELCMIDNEQKYNQFKNNITKLEQQNQQLLDLTKESRKIIQNEMMKTFITKLIFYQKYNRESSEEIIYQKSKQIFSNQLLNKANLQFDYITGQKNQIQILEIKNELNETIIKMGKLEQQNIKIVMENNYLKRNYQSQYEQIEFLENELEQIKKDQQSKIVNNEIIKRENKEIELLQKGLVTQGELLKSIIAERDRLHKEVVQLSFGKYKTEKSVQVDQMVRAAKSIVSFQGWNNLSFIKNIKYRESKGTITDLQDIRKECTLEPFPNRFQIYEPTFQQLRTFYKLPLVDNECQTQMVLMKDFMKQKGYRHKQSLKKPLQDENSLLIENEDVIYNTCNSCSSDEINKLIGEKLEKFEKQKEQEKLNKMKIALNQQIQCDILDYEQINLFISDSLCFDSSLRKIVEAKRRFEIIPDGQTDYNYYIGGMRIKQKGEKLREEQKEEMKNQLKQMQSSLLVQKKEFSTNKFPLLQGVYSRLWKDAGLKEERMEHLRREIEDMLREQLMKKLIVQNKNKSENSHLKNSLIIKNFLDQVNKFIKSNLRTISPQQENKSTQNNIKQIDIKAETDEDRDSQKSSGSLLFENKMQMQYGSQKDNQLHSNLNLITKNISKQSIEAKDILQSCKYFQDQLKLIIHKFRKQTKQFENSQKRNKSLSQDKKEVQINLQSKQKNQYIKVKIRPQTSSSICQEDRKFLENQYGHLINIQDKKLNLSQTNNSTKSKNNKSFQQFQISNEILKKDSLNFSNISIQHKTKINSPHYIEKDLDLMKYKQSRNQINLKHLTAPKTQMKQSQIQKQTNISKEDQNSTGNFQSVSKELGSLLEIQKKDLTELHPYSYSIDTFREVNQLYNYNTNQDFQFQAKRKSHQQFTNSFLIDDIYKKQQSNIQIEIKDQKIGQSQNIQNEMKKINSFNIMKKIQSQKQYVFDLYEQDRQLQKRLNNNNDFKKNKIQDFILQNQSLKESFRNFIHKDFHGINQNYLQKNNSTENIDYQQRSQQNTNELYFQTNSSDMNLNKSIDKQNNNQKQKLREIIMKNDKKLKEYSDIQNENKKVFSSSQYQLQIKRQSLKQNINSQAILKMVSNKQSENKDKKNKKQFIDNNIDQKQNDSLSTLKKLAGTDTSSSSINQKHYVNKNFIVDRQSQGYMQRIKNDFSNNLNAGQINVLKKNDTYNTQYYKNI